MKLEQMRARQREIEAELRQIHTDAGEQVITGDAATRFDTLVAERDQLTADITAEEQRSTVRQQLAADVGREQLRSQLTDAVRSGLRTEHGDGARGAGPAVHVRRDPFEGVIDQRGALTPDVLGMTARARRTAMVDANLRAVEGRIDRGEDQAHFETIVRRHAGDTAWAANILARSRPEYSEAFAAVVTGTPVALLEEELRAALVVGTNANGGYMVPTHLDPTIILTNAGSSNVMRPLATVRTLTTGNVWHGVTSAGVTASWDAELAEVSDDTPTVGTQSITPLKAQAFVQASVEALQDIAGLESDVMALFADARDRLEGAAHMTGAGSTTAPLGLFTAINASSSLQTTSTTAATIGEVDIHALYRALPVRWRGRGTFVMHPLYALAIKRLGTAVSSAFSGDLTAPVTDRILGRPVVESDDAPTTQTTTALDQEIVFADLSAYTIVDMPGGTSVEYVPHLFHTDNNLPKGVRGWIMYWRTGAGMPNLAAGRILVDKTSA